MSFIISHKSAARLWRNARVSEGCHRYATQAKQEDKIGSLSEEFIRALCYPTQAPHLLRLPSVSKACISPSHRSWHLATDFAATHELPLPLELLVFDRAGRKHASSYQCNMQSKLPDKMRFLRYSEQVLLCKPELILVQMATRLKPLDLLRLAYEYCASYELLDMIPRGFGDCLPLTNRSRLRLFAQNLPGCRGSRALLHATDLLCNGSSASPKETGLAMMLTLPPELGGYGLPPMTLNARIDLGRQAQAVYDHPYCVCDLMYPSLDIEYNSWAEHGNKNTREHDSQRALALMLEGLEVIDVYDSSISTIEGTDSLAKLIAQKLGIRIDLAQGGPNRARREQLRRICLGHHKPLV